MIVLGIDPGFRTGVKVYVAPPGLPRDGAIEDMAVVTEKGAELLPNSLPKTPAAIEKALAR